MKRWECECEADVLAATLQSRWPDRVDESFRRHVENCEICADASHDEIRASAMVPDARRKMAALLGRTPGGEA